MKTEIDLMGRFKRELCSFDMSKKAKKAGMTCANTYFMYNKDGELGDGAWLEDITGMEMYPAINFSFAVTMLEDTDIEYEKIVCYKLNGEYFLEYKDEKYHSKNIVDLLIMIWIEHK